MEDPHMCPGQHRPVSAWRAEDGRRERRGEPWWQGGRKAPPPPHPPHHSPPGRPFPAGCVTAGALHCAPAMAMAVGCTTPRAWASPKCILHSLPAKVHGACQLDHSSRFAFGPVGAFGAEVVQGEGRGVLSAFGAEAVGPNSAWGSISTRP